MKRIRQLLAFTLFVVIFSACTPPADEGTEFTMPQSLEEHQSYIDNIISKAVAQSNFSAFDESYASVASFVKGMSTETISAIGFAPDVTDDILKEILLDLNGLVFSLDVAILSCFITEGTFTIVQDPNGLVGPTLSYTTEGVPGKTTFVYDENYKLVIDVPEMSREAALESTADISGDYEFVLYDGDDTEILSVDAELEGLTMQAFRSALTLQDFIFNNDKDLKLDMDLETKTHKLSVELTKELLEDYVDVDLEFATQSSNSIYDLEMQYSRYKIAELGTGLMMMGSDLESFKLGILDGLFVNAATKDDVIGRIQRLYGTLINLDLLLEIISDIELSFNYDDSSELPEGTFFMSEDAQEGVPQLMLRLASDNQEYTLAEFFNEKAFPLTGSSVIDMYFPKKIVIMK